MGKKSQAKKKRFRSTSTIDQHERLGSKLVPPLTALLNMQPVSWSNDQIPEFLWAALLIADLGRVRALNRFRDVADFVYKQSSGTKVADVSHSALANAEPDVLRDLLAVIARERRYASALSPLLLLENLPARDAWAAALGHADEKRGWEGLMDGVAKVFDHQSQEATDCRWLKVLVGLLAGRLHLPWKDRIEEILQYPSLGDMRRVRPSIRATEMSLRNLDNHPGDHPASDWVQEFWAQCYRDTACFGFVEHPVADRPGIGLDEIKSLFNSVAEHADRFRSTTAPDARHDVVFGTVLYGITTLHEIVEGRIDGGILGQVGLRVIAECAITLAYLLAKDVRDLWSSYRAYGAGQAKLTFLKFEDVIAPPHSIDVEVLERLANEDLWQEFVPIELGHWEKSSLRKMSEDAAVKDSVYDPFYQWPSQFAHGHWGAIRDTVFTNCANPLHRFHRVPRPAPRQLPPTVDEAIGLVNRLLELMDKAYPSLGVRIVAVSSDQPMRTTEEPARSADQPDDAPLPNEV